MIFSSDEIYLTKYTSDGIQRALRNINYNTSKILVKSFNIFKLKELIRQDNVLPIMRKTILEAFGNMVIINQIAHLIQQFEDQYFLLGSNLIFLKKSYNHNSIISIKS